MENLPGSGRLPGAEEGMGAGFGVAGFPMGNAAVVDGGFGFSAPASFAGSLAGSFGEAAALVSAGPFAAFAPLLSFTSPSSTSAGGFPAPGTGVNSGADARREELVGVARASSFESVDCGCLVLYLI